MVCLQLYVSGIDKKATEYQVYSFFKSISDDVTGVHLIENKTYEGQQKAIVYFSRQNTINYVIKTINYQVIDGWILKCNLNNVYIGNDVPTNKSKVILQFPINYDMKRLTHRKIFEIMEVCGPILDITIKENLRKVFVHFISEQSAKNALSAKCDCGVTITQNACYYKQSSKQVLKQCALNTTDMFKPYIPRKDNTTIFSESDFPSLSELDNLTSNGKTQQKQFVKQPIITKVERNSSKTAI